MEDGQGGIGDVAAAVADRGVRSVRRGLLAAVMASLVVAVAVVVLVIGPAGPLGDAPDVRVDGIAEDPGSPQFMPGATLTVTGAQLTGISRAELGGRFAEIRRQSDDRLEILVPAIPEAPTATLTLFRGESPCFSRSIAVLDPATPFVNPPSPAESAVPYRTGAVIAVDGARLDEVSAVTIGDVPAPIVSQTGTVLRVSVPAQLIGGASALLVYRGDEVVSRVPVTLESPRVVFIGDSYTSGVGASAPAHTTAALIAAGMGWDVTNLAVGGTGYGRSLDDRIARDACGAGHCPSYAEALTAIRDQPDILVVFGGRNQAGEDSAPVAAEIEDFYVRAHRLLPHTRIIAVSPTWDDDAEPETFASMIAAVSRAAQANQDHFIDLGDPLVGRPDAVGADGVHPNDLGHRLIAEAFLAEARSLR